MWNITVVDDSMRKQFSKEKGDQMAALPATVGGLSVDIPVGTVRRSLAIAELSGSDTVSITISLERLVDLTQTVAGLVGNSWMRLLAKRRCRLMWNPVMVLGIGAAASAALPVSPVEDEQGLLVGGPEVGDIYSVGTDMSDLRRLDEEVDELMGSGVPTTREYLRVHQKRSRIGERLLRRHFGESGDSRGETCDTQTQQYFIGE